MAYDEKLADEIREIVASERGVEEKRMFGGLAFLVNGNMSVAVSRQGGLLVRVPAEDLDKVLRRDHVGPMVMGGRDVRGWVRVDTAGLRTRRQLQVWVTRGVGYARGLPPK
ncbi:TfoX/Sxy family protein [Mycobacterium sp. E2497]|uniref:TfoX/Sxy family protein n=1 Tax=Mycobacterium sp. E2497 TaxID=1834135 RepID=UPI00080145EA|nr:TfoX/Sxy family protein [Mycobacterium sp. E2497]OBI20244.1 RNA methyltransferase [Mycobacterium sp. E2497]